ncbi:MAG: hypothetical protein JKX82_01940 [Oleispira sp.]|nr:hypothetical protein [Oleispira sp.]
MKCIKVFLNISKKLISRRYFLLLIAGIPISSSWAITVDLTRGGESISILQSSMYPETIVFNKNNGRYLLGSFREGKIYELNDEGLYRVLVDDERLSSILGITIDYERNRIYVTNADFGASLKSHKNGPKKLAAVGIYELNSGNAIDYIDLGDLLPNNSHLTNGIALDTDGNVYVSDSFSAAIYKIDFKGKANVFLKNKEFEGEGINLNGIVYHNGGFLLVINKRNGQLYKIPLDKPEEFIKIKSSVKLVGGDGLLLADDNSLLIVANITSGIKSNSIYSVTTEDNWNSMVVANRRKLDDIYPTTLVIKEGKIFVLQSSLNKLITSSKLDKEKLRSDVIITQVGITSP